jgi:hypothetical protein
MREKISTLSRCIVGAGLAMLMIGLLILTNVSPAHASSLRNTTTGSDCTSDSSGSLTGGVVKLSSPVTGVYGYYNNNSARTKAWFDIGEVYLMYSKVCGMYWTAFTPTSPANPPGVSLDSTAFSLYLYSQGEGLAHASCTILYPCQTLPLILTHAQAVASADITSTPTYTTVVLYSSWKAYGIASQY